MNITLANIVSSAIEFGRRILTVTQFGAKTSQESSPFGDDSNPLQGMTAVFAETTEIGEPVIIGYINENQLAAVGEKRLYSLDENGNESTFVWLKNNGNLELNGNTFSAVRFQNLQVSLQNSDTAINVELNKIAAAITTLGGTYVPVVIQTNIDNSESENVKLK